MIRGSWMALFLMGCPGPDPVEPPVPTKVVEGLLINEVQAANETSWEDPDATGCVEYDDWIELINTTDAPVTLLGLFLTDDVADLKAWALPDVTLQPGERALVVADSTPEQGAWHANFKVSREGEELVLSDVGGRVVDRVLVPPMDGDAAWGRAGDGMNVFAEQAYPTPGEANQVWADDPCLVDVGGFDDHTAPCLATPDGYHRMSNGRTTGEVVKFDVVAFWDDDARDMVFLDTNFYKLHDEWYFFRMLNGQTVVGENLFLPYDGHFETIEEIYAWASAVDLGALFDPDFLSWAGNRLSSRRYYEMALGDDPRILGAGTLAWFPANELHEEVWAFELEFSDEITHPELMIYFDALESALPPSIDGDLKWLVRSPHQEELAQQMERDGMARAGRVLRYQELSAPGAVEVYNPGAVAGRVRIVRAGEDGLEDSGPDDILVLEEIPDYLPPCAALITSVPQTPLAHIALLAESRGIPNLYVADITDDPAWDQWGRVRSFVALQALLPGSMDVTGITGQQWARWRDLGAPALPVLPVVDVASLPYTVDLTTVQAEQAFGLRPALGGKSVGMVVLREGESVDAPDHPLGITVRAYADHMEGVIGVAEVLAGVRNGTLSGRRARFLALEGREAYDERYRTPADVTYAQGFVDDRPPGDVLGDLARGRGLVGAVRAAPVPADVLVTITAALSEQFADFAGTQGLRFRSSSNVEDIEGFNGAGLYSSYTGFLNPPEGEDRTVASALVRTWASYWGAEAFEERHDVGVEHLDGAMGVLVHARFDDAYEVGNGVVVTTRMPDGQGERWQMVFNAQDGALSVTNPPVSDTCAVVLPEVVRVHGGEDDVPVIERVQPSSETEGPVISDARVLELFVSTRSVVQHWLDEENVSLLNATMRSTLTLDFEYREMDVGWPALVSGVEGAPRLVLKQSRSLEPSTSHLPAQVVVLPAPRDVLARAREVDRVVCTAEELRVSIDRVTTEAQRLPDMGFSDEPLAVRVRVDVLEDLPEVGWLAGDAVELVHTSLSDVTWPITLGVTVDSVEAALSYVSVEDGEGWMLTSDGVSTGGSDVQCMSSTQYSSPDTFLEGLLQGG